MTFKKIAKGLRRGAAIAAALLLPGAASARAPAAAHPASWEVSDADTKIYLFGTIHLLPENYSWLTPTLEAAMADSQELVVETIVDDKNPAKMMQAMTQLAFSPGLPPLTDRVPAAKRKALADAVKASGVPPQAFDRMETWADAFLLLGNQFRSIGLKGGEGVEFVLRKAFADKGRPIGELETNVEQLGFFDKLPEKAQRDLLLGAISPGKGAKTEFDSMLSAWAQGNVPLIAKTFDRDLSSSPDLQQSLMYDRNRNWSGWVRDRMTRPGTVMVAVGAGHLAGKKSLISLLQQQGYTVSRLQ